MGISLSPNRPLHHRFDATDAPLPQLIGVEFGLFVRWRKGRGFIAWIARTPSTPLPALLRPAAGRPGKEANPDIREKCIAGKRVTYGQGRADIGPIGHGQTQEAALANLMRQVDAVFAARTALIPAALQER